MRRLIGAVIAAAFGVILVMPGTVLASVTPGIGSYASGTDSAGGALSFGFDNLLDNNLRVGTKVPGRFMYSLNSTFTCIGKTTGYSVNTFDDEPAKYADNVLDPFPAVTRSYHSFSYLFTDKYRNASERKDLGTATVSFTGRIKQISGPAGGPGKVIANGTIGIRVSSSCRTGTLKWSAKGSIVKPPAS
jgi:hypothetical protein